MKKIIIPFLFCYCALTYGQDSIFSAVPLKNGKIYYSGIVNIDSVSKDELYYRAKRWFVDTYSSAQDNIQIDDKENGEIVGKGCFRTYWDVTLLSGMEVNICQTVRILIKDGKYKYEFKDFFIRYYVAPDQSTNGSDVDMQLENWKSYSKKNSQRIFKKIDASVNDLIRSLSAALKTKPEEWWLTRAKNQEPRAKSQEPRAKTKDKR